MNSFFYVALIILIGLVFGKLAKLVKLPNVTGYLVGGLIFGPYVLGILPSDVIHSLDFVSNIALSFIAFTIGAEFKMSFFKRVGFTPIVIALFEALMAVLLVTLALVILKVDLAFAILLGAIAAATAPAATIMVINQYKAKGPVTETLLSVVALDDIVALVAFGFASAIANSIEGGALSIMVMIDPLIEVLKSIGIGAILGLIFAFSLKFYRSRANTLGFGIAYTLLAFALADYFGASTLLTPMVMGGVLVNLSNRADFAVERINLFTPPLFTMFFVISGAELNLSVLGQIGLIGAVYIIVRVIGKLLGASLGASIMHADKNIRKYLGPALIPQAGVAIGLTVIAGQTVPQYAELLTAIVLCATLVYEMVGPVISKITLVKAGEIKKENL